MGPRSGEHGERTLAPHMVQRAALQWGRALVSTERRFDPMSNASYAIALQWGRALVSTERPGGEGRADVDQHRFNGAALW